MLAHEHMYSIYLLLFTNHACNPTFLSIRQYPLLAAVKVAVVAMLVAKRIVGHLRCLSYRVVVGHRSRLWVEIFNEPDSPGCREPRYIVLVDGGMPLAGVGTTGWQGGGGLLTYHGAMSATGCEVL